MKKKSKVILLESIRSMQNVGAIFRNADGAGFEKLILTGYTPYPPRNDISKTALGAENMVDWEYARDPFLLVKNLQKNGYKIWSIELDNQAIDYKDIFQNTEEKVCLVVGNEIDGVSQKMKELSDKLICIPMRGKKESLNVSVASGIVMYAV